MRWSRKAAASFAAKMRITGQKHSRSSAHVLKSSLWDPGGGKSLESTPACLGGLDLVASGADEGSLCPFM